ncbi:MAG: ABC transporter substrate-binding protein [Chloroflexi bacterium]|nr:ABC transporter substrate-binding protein [Chloroflexota bacterium]
MRCVRSNPKCMLAGLLLAASLATLACAQPAPPTPTPAAKAPAAAPPTPAPKPAATAAPQPTRPAPSTPSAAKPAEVTLVRSSHLGVASDAYTYIALEKGYFRDEGLNVELTALDTAAKMIAPMAANQLDVGGGSLSAGLLNAIVRDVPIKIVADRSRLSPDPNRQAFGLAARKDLIASGALKDYSDMRGKNVAFNFKGTGNELDVEKALKKGNLSWADVNAVEMAFADMIAAFGNKAIDVSLIFEPFVTIGRDRGVADLWKPAIDFAPDRQMAILMYSPGFIKEKPEAAKRFMVAYVKGIRDYYNAFFKNQNKTEVIGILTKYSNTKDPAMFEKMAPHGIDPNGSLNVKGILEDRDWFEAKGYTKDKLDEKALIDQQYLEYALQRLGKYQ